MNMIHRSISLCLGFGCLVACAPASETEQSEMRQAAPFPIESASTKAADEQPSSAGTPQKSKTEANAGSGEKSTHADADKLMRQAEDAGLKAESDNDLELGRRAMELFREATDVAPDYPKTWEKYALSLTELRSRFGHSLIMSNREIRREVKRCKEALAELQ